MATRKTTTRAAKRSTENTAKKPTAKKANAKKPAKKKLWTSPGGKTPEATLYASILRDLKKGKDARFKKVDRGQVALAKRK